MNDRTRGIWRWYTGENGGVQTNPAPLLSHSRLAGTGKLVILHVDHGLEHGPGQPM
jgi:class I fructose-bisphosphate aldolase